MIERTNQEWLAALRGPDRKALSDLRAFLVRGLRYALAGQSNVDEAIREDFAQDAMLKILANLDSFRGESRFTTWALKIAVRVAFTELRRRRWRDVSLNGLRESPGITLFPDTLVDPTAGPEQQALQTMMLDTLRRIIAEELTDKQRLALVAARVQGMPLEEVARRMGTNRNALYKLLHDARQRLKNRLQAEGLSPEDVLGVFS
ncbi:MAG: sigma-70 family RNA polymerase sigma factor [Chloroflexi bacterium]|nr:sigma-70 family RNA polymerase sigma factor [Chloroflexota bacterium]MBU1748661.1 sigma-70 family RNA polymerase sigma factor [Chloroflexota bacterium]